jgi:hypothetical protein
MTSGPGALADIKMAALEILSYIRDDDDEWEEEDEDPPERLEKLLAEDENYQALLKLIERARIELETGLRASRLRIAQLRTAQAR